MPNEYLDFEEPIAVLERKILDLQSSELDENRDLTKEINKLNDSIVKLTDKVYQNLTIWQCVQVARHPQRPHLTDYIEKICSNFDELQQKSTLYKRISIPYQSRNRNDDD